MGGWTVTLKGGQDVTTDADHENLRSFSRNIVRAAEAYGLGPSEATVSPALGTSDVGVTPSEQVAAADKHAEAMTERDTKARETAAAETAKAKAAQAKAEAKDNK